MNEKKEEKKRYLLKVYKIKTKLFSNVVLLKVIKNNRKNGVILIFTRLVNSC